MRYDLFFSSVLYKILYVVREKSTMAYFGIILLFSGLDVVYSEWHKLSSQACFEITMLRKIFFLQ